MRAALYVSRLLYVSRFKTCLATSETRAHTLLAGRGLFAPEGRRFRRKSSPIPAGTPLAPLPEPRIKTRPQASRNHRGERHGDRIFHDAFASAGVRVEGRPGLGPPGSALARRARLSGGLDRRTSHRAVGAPSRAGPADRAGAVADQEHPHRSRRIPVALSSSRRTRQPRGDARPMSTA